MFYFESLSVGDKLFCIYHNKVILWLDMLLPTLIVYSILHGQLPVILFKVPK